MSSWVAPNSHARLSSQCARTVQAIHLTGEGHAGADVARNRWRGVADAAAELLQPGHTVQHQDEAAAEPGVHVAVDDRVVAAVMLKKSILIARMKSKFFFYFLIISLRLLDGKNANYY